MRVSYDVNAVITMPDVPILESVEWRPAEKFHCERGKQVEIHKPILKSRERGLKRQAPEDSR